MAYSVNWVTKIVTIPKADLTLVSAPNVFELNVLSFWAEIHDIQDDEGITYESIMASNAPSEIGGVILQRVVEIINGYKIEFEDGQYLVNLVGANNNIFIERVVNQVSVNPSNSAGAIVVDGSGGGFGSYTESDRVRDEETHDHAQATNKQTKKC